MLGWAAAVSDRVPVTAQAGRDPKNIEFGDRVLTIYGPECHPLLPRSVDDIINSSVPEVKRRCPQTSWRRWPSKPVGKGQAGVGGYAHSHDFLNIGGEEVFCCLAGIAAGDKEI